ncbi:hypothetical protein BC829DRAFT_436919 [Chytridium lagenaria]|nr:hypothetical protein BC829DRAFT_436919 [Chytridium lagenaria]
MEVDATFKNGSKRLLISLLNAVKDFNKPNSLSLRFSSKGITSRFACGPPMHPLQSIISFTLDTQDDDVLPTPAASPTPGAKEVDVKEKGLGKPGTAFAGFESRSETVITVHPRTLCHQLELVDEDHGRKVLYEMDAVPHVEPIPPTVSVPKYTFIVQIEAEEFRRTIAALHETSEKVLVTGTKNSITFCSTGPIGTLQVGLVQKPTPPNKIPRFKVLSYTSNMRLTFDSRFLRGFTIATPLSTYVTLSFGGPQTPMKITYPIEADSLADGSIKLASLATVHPSNTQSPTEEGSPVLAERGGWT